MKYYAKKPRRGIKKHLVCFRRGVSKDIYKQDLFFLTLTVFLLLHHFIQALLKL